MSINIKNYKQSALKSFVWLNAGAKQKHGARSGALIGAFDQSAYTAIILASLTQHP